MKWLLCLVVGHQKTLMAFSSNRFSCRRCGADLGRDVPATPSPPTAARTHPTPREADPLSSFLRERVASLPAGIDEESIVCRPVRRRAQGCGAIDSTVAASGDCRVVPVSGEAECPAAKVGKATTSHPAAGDDARW